MTLYINYIYHTKPIKHLGNFGTSKTPIFSLIILIFEVRSELIMKSQKKSIFVSNQVAKCVSKAGSSHEINGEICWTIDDLKEFDDGSEVDKPEGKAHFIFIHAVQNDGLHGSLVTKM